MGNIAQQFSTAFRDFVSDGIASSGAHDVVKSEVREIGPLIEAALGSINLASVDVIKATRSDLNADLAFVADSLALVYADATDANNDLYVKVGGSGSGSWTLTTILHDLVAGLFAPQIALAAAEADRAEAAAEQYNLENRTPEDETAGYAWPIIINEKLFGGITETGEWDAPAIRVTISGVTGEDAGTGFKPLISLDGADLGFIVGYNAQGELDFKPSPELIARIEASGFVPVSALRGTYGSEVFNVRRASSTLYTATVRDASGRSFDCTQLITGAQNTLVIADSTAPLELVLLMGQSNAGEGGAGGVLYSSAAYPFSAFQLAGVANGQAYGNTLLSVPASPDFVAAADLAGGAGVRGQYPAKMIAFALQHYNAETGRAEPGVVVGTAWEGSQPLASFFPATSGHYNYESAVNYVAGVKAAALKYGRAINLTLVFIQGEAGPSGRTTYGNLLDDLLDAILPGLQTAAGMASAPKVVLVQTNVLQGASENDACLGQYDVAQARAGTVLAAPMYQLPFYDVALGTPLPRMMQAGPVAEAIVSLLDTGDWKPVQIASAARSGTFIDLTFEGTVFDQGYALEVDADWVPTVANLGFTASSTGGATLSSAAITGKKTVRLTFSGSPNAGTVVEYAMAANSANTGWAFRLGNLMVKTARRDYFHKIGFPVPQFVRHYAIRQKFTTS